MTGKILRFTIVVTALLVSAAGWAWADSARDPVKVKKRVAMMRNAERDLVHKTVVDAAARQRLIELLDERDRLVFEHIETIETYRRRMSDLNANYHATPEMFEAAVAEYRRARAAWQEEAVALLAAMKAETTAKEWRTLVKFKLRKLEFRDVAYTLPEREP